MQVYTTLRSGGEFLPKHVQVLAREVLKWSPPGTTFSCLSDIDIPGVDVIPFKTNWPTWWGKMELLGPEFRGDLLFMDIDTVITGPLDDFLRAGQPLSTHRGCVALMFMPEAARVEPGEIFRKDAERIIEEYWGEDIFLRAVWTGQFSLPKTFADTVEDKLACGMQYEDVLPGQLLYRKKKSAFDPPRPIVLGSNTRLIMFQGDPRPWRTPEYRHLYR
jgi:hypothetical protein